MYIYPENTGQWRIDLIENPPPSASMFEHIEWRDIVLNELFKHGNLVKFLKDGNLSL